MTLQPIVENAVRHGVTKRSSGGTVTISTDETESHYIAIVEDDGVGFSPGEIKRDGLSHTGIQNVESRLKAMCGGSLKITSGPGGTRVVIEIPKDVGE